MSATTIQPNSQVTKDPNAARSYQFDWDDLLGASVEIASMTVSETSGTSGLTIGTPALAVGNRKVNVLISAGTLGATYRVTCRVTTNETPAQIEDASFDIFIAHQ